ncbi:MAG: Hsp70 family protein [Xanthomonadales bacterium]|jgi:molecular chaperone HscC|nr:Hsp70 family protein [Xanthomonadales bacterium]
MAIVGIDLGTTHSLISHFTRTAESEPAPRLVANVSGGVLTPSAVALRPDGSVLTGAAALEACWKDPAHAVTGFKRYMGSNREWTLRGRRFRAEELSALVLKALVADAEAATGERVREAVISVPAYFSEAQRQATRTAGQLAGLAVERLINEPTAAALAYGLARREGGRFLIFDLGGGTFDVSILEMFEGVMQVHATAGDNHLGGEDFLDLLEKQALEQCGLATLSATDRASLRPRLERAKQQLSRDAGAELAVTLAGQSHTLQFTETGFAAAAAPLLTRLRQPLERALRDAGLKPADLDEVVLVGGAAQMPMVVRMVTKLFGRLPLRHLKPDQVVGLGTGVAAGLKARHAALEEVILTDVCPYTLGVSVSRSVGGHEQSGYYSPIIERNSTVPISRVERYEPVRDAQTQLTLKVYQGESPRVAGNVLLGEIEVPLRPGVPRGENAIDVRFTYDVNGLLQVEVTRVADGARYEKVLKRVETALDAGEIAERLAALHEIKLHPRENAANLAVLARAERLYEEGRGRERELLLGWITEFEALLDHQDLPRIAEARAEFGARLDEFETTLLR